MWVPVYRPPTSILGPVSSPVIKSGAHCFNAQGAEWDLKGKGRGKKSRLPFSTCPSIQTSALQGWPNAVAYAFVLSARKGPLDRPIAGFC